MPNHAIRNQEKPKIGIIMLDTDFPRIPGDIGHPATFPFSVRYRIVKGASPRRVVKSADPLLLEPFVEAALDLERQGVRMITTSCGFLSIYQRELSNAVHIPLYSSALLQVKLVQQVIGRDQTVGIITADKYSLTPNHFRSVGINRMPTAVIGMQDAPEFSSVFLGGKTTLDEGKCRSEMENATRRLIAVHPRVGAIVLECTNMPPYREVVRMVSALPVFDVLTMVHHAVSALKLHPDNRYS